MGRKTMMAGTARLLRTHAREIAPVLLVSAAVLLVVEHWKHFDRSDAALLALILASAAVQVFVREGKTSASSARNKSDQQDRT
jgi:hypothetical protein